MPHRRLVGAGVARRKMTYKPAAATDRKARVVLDADDLLSKNILAKIFFLDMCHSARCTPLLHAVTAVTVHSECTTVQATSERRVNGLHDNQLEADMAHKTGPPIL